MLELILNGSSQLCKLLDLEPMFTGEQLEVASWMVGKYSGLYAQALQFSCQPEPVSARTGWCEAAVGCGTGSP